MLFNATILAVKGTVVVCRVFNPSTRTWYDGASFVAGLDTLAYQYPLTATTLTDTVFDRYGAQLTLPEGEYTLEYVDVATLDVLGEDDYGIRVDIDAIPVAGGGDTPVNQDTGGTDNLTPVYNSVGVNNVIIKAYLKTNYDAGLIADAYVLGTATSTVDGSWDGAIYLDSGFTYTIVFYKQGEYQTATAEVTI